MAPFAVRPGKNREAGVRASRLPHRSGACHFWPWAPRPDPPGQAGLFRPNPAIKKKKKYETASQLPNFGPQTRDPGPTPRSDQVRVGPTKKIKKSPGTVNWPGSRRSSAQNETNGLRAFRQFCPIRPNRIQACPSVPKRDWERRLPTRPEWASNLINASQVRKKANPWVAPPTNPCGWRRLRVAEPGAQTATPDASWQRGLARRCAGQLMIGKSLVLRVLTHATWAEILRL